ncbi:trypsin-like serine protease [Streptomyces sp. NPDC017546]|uniref:trypsin-like serine protease n=1 Tax=Streptomyces sp. NPDC017546 TaxID=3365001 RepID=UPI00379B3DDF
MRLSRTTTAIGAALAIAFPLIPASNYSASAAESGLPASEAPSQADRNTSHAKALMMRQAPILDAADEITELVKKDPISGYNELTISVETNGYTLRWKGRPPENVTRVIASHRKKGLNVKVATARYTATELKKAIDAIAKSDVRINGAEIVSVGAGKDGNSLTVGIDVPDTAPRATAQPLKTGEVIPSSLTRGIPVTLKADSVATPIGDERIGMPSSMQFGGQAIKTWGGARCTTGFTASSRGSVADYVITAEHCVTGTGQKWLTADESSLGTVSYTDTQHDAALIELDPRKSTGGGLVGGLPVRNSFQPVHHVHSAREVRAGQYVCVSGSLTGERCGVPVVEGYYWRQLNGVQRWTAVTGDSPWEYIAGKGDSGGPVYSYNVSGGVVGHGLMSATQYGTTCSNPFGGTRSACSNKLYFTSLPSALAMMPTGIFLN